MSSSDFEKFTNAAREGHLNEVIETSKKFSSDVKALNKSLIESCLWGHLDVVKWLADNTMADVDCNNSEGSSYSPLTAACRNDHLGIVKYLVETCNADVNLADSKSHTPLTKACRYVSVLVLKYLLCEIRELDVNLTFRYSNTALHYIVWSRKDDNAQLHNACERRDVNEVNNLVIVMGLNVNEQNNDGDTPLHIACLNFHSDIVETLMIAGADETMKNERKKTPAQRINRKHRNDLKLLDKVSLWKVMNRQRNIQILSVFVWMMLAVRQMRQR